MPPILETHMVSNVYRNGGQSTRAVDDVSIQIERGEFVALVGPSGSGKTTLLAILAGLLAPTDGVVSIDGQALSRLGEGKRARFRREKIGLTFQANNLVPYLTVLENVTLTLRLNGMYDRASRQRARDLLTRLGLEDRLDYLPRQISGGQQQRVAIARALIHLPSVVLADEPTASLDTERAVQVIETFATLIHEQNRAGVMVTHDLRMVKYVDRVIQMLDGRVARILDGRADISCLADPADCRPVPLDVLDSGATVRECPSPY